LPFISSVFQGQNRHAGDEDGDHITGEVKRLEGGALQVELDYVDGETWPAWKAPVYSSYSSKTAPFTPAE